MQSTGRTMCNDPLRQCYLITKDTNTNPYREICIDLDEKDQDADKMHARERDPRLSKLS